MSIETTDHEDLPPSGDDRAAHDRDKTEILSVIKRFWAAMDARDTATAAPLVSADAVFIDAFAPHIWSGGGAFEAWLRDLWAFCAAQDIAAGSTAIRDPARCMIAGARAYVVSPAMMASARDGGLVSQPGVITTTLRLAGGAWLITGQCWSGQ